MTVSSAAIGRYQLSIIRTLAGVGVMYPAAAYAIAWALTCRNKRSGANRFTAMWPALLLSITGVNLNVSGRSNLTVRRPAVFIFNHRTNHDGFMVSALVRDNWTSVIKKENVHHPVVGVQGWFLDSVYIDRSDTDDALAGMRRVEERVRDGMSVLMAPEGTRALGPELGPFKKGAFRLAMSTGIPIIPIVIRNADSVGGRDGLVLTPGTVDIAVLAPIPVHDWTVADLPDHIAEVQQLFVSTLRDWPQIQSPDVGAEMWEHKDRVVPP